MAYSNLTATNFTHGNGAKPLEEANTVSWQSAFWPVAACTAALLLQNVGRVSGAAYRDSYALRASPVICAFDTSMMLIKFVWMLVLGCSLRTAARHVWYDRFVTQDDQTAGTLMFHADGWTCNEFKDPIEGKPPRSRTGHHSRNGHTPVLSTDADHDTRDLSGETNDQTCMETFHMSGALPTLRPVIVQLDTLHGDGEIANVTLELLETSENSSDGALSINESLSVSGGTDSPAGCDIETGHTMTTGACPLDLGKYSNFHSGCEMDRAWRLTMAGFLVGALPQAIKIFGMCGVAGTQVLVGLQVMAFAIPEIFRVMAGKLEATELRPMPSIVFAKAQLENDQDVILFALSVASMVPCFLFLGLWGTFDIVDGSFNSLKGLVLINMLLVAPLIATVLYYILKKGRLALGATPSSLKAITLPQSVKTIGKRTLTKILDVFAVQTPRENDSVLLGLLYLLSASTTQFPLNRIAAACGDEVLLMQWLAFISFSLVLPAVLIPSYTLFRILFMGSLSKYPRRLSGLEGTWSEFAKFAYIGSHALALITLYTTKWYSSDGTYKPAWADMLG